MAVEGGAPWRSGERRSARGTHPAPGGRSSARPGPDGGSAGRGVHHALPERQGSAQGWAPGAPRG